MGAFRSEGRRFGGRSGERSGGFNRGRGRSFGRDRSSGRERGPREMHSATCDKCGKHCEVPFKPTEGKPIFCDDCFKQNDNRGSRDNRSSGSGDLSQINAKLDKIIAILNNLEVETDDDSDEEEPEEVEEESK